MNSDIFIPVRLNSSRLPHKHLKEINGKPALKCLINRLSSARKIRNIIVCTTNQNSDDPLIKFLQKENILYFRGNEKDILVRFLDAANYFNTDIIIDVEGDKIYTDPKYVDKIVDIMEKNDDIDYVMGSTTLDTVDHSDHSVAAVIPAGIRKSSLEKVCKLKKTDNTETGYREFFTGNDLFNCKYILPEIHSEIPKNLRLTLDYQEDLNFARVIFKELGDNFSFENILHLLQKKPDLLKITELIIEKWKRNYKNTQTDFSLNDST